MTAPVTLGRGIGSRHFGVHWFSYDAAHVIYLDMWRLLVTLSWQRLR